MGWAHHTSIGDGERSGLGRKLTAMNIENEKSGLYVPTDAA